MFASLVGICDTLLNIQVKTEYKIIIIFDMRKMLFIVNFETNVGALS